MNPILVFKRFITSSDWRFRYLAAAGFYNHMDDETYLKKVFQMELGYPLNLDNPQTFNEKLQWLKLYNRKPEYTMMVDKYAVRKYIADTIGEQYLIPLLGVWDSPDEIDFDALPNRFVLKCNHNSGTGMCICRDKSKLDIKKVKAELRKGLKENYYLHGREWPYKDVPRKIICEKYMEDKPAQELTDYKLMCFGGEVQCIFTCTDRFSPDGLKVTFFDKDWNLLPFTRHYPASEIPIEAPKQLKKMIALSETLSAKLPFVRTDFYEVNGNIYFGELTLSPGCGFEEFDPEEWDEKLGKLITLPGGGGYIIEGSGWMLWLKYGKAAKPRNNAIELKGLTDYKFYCFDGEPRFLYVSRGLEDHATAQISFLTLDWQFADFGRSDYAPLSELPPKPICYDEMLELARILAAKIPFVRADFYECGGQIYFGELTFSPCGGFMHFEPAEWDEKIGKLVKISWGGGI